MREIQETVEGKNLTFKIYEKRELIPTGQLRERVEGIFTSLDLIEGDYPDGDYGTSMRPQQVQRASWMREGFQEAWEDGVRGSSKYPARRAVAQEMVDSVTDLVGLPRIRCVVKDAKRNTAWPAKGYISFCTYTTDSFTDIDGMSDLMLVAIHEVAHFVEWLLYGGDVNHGRDFQRVESSMQRAWGIYPAYTYVPGYWRRIYTLDDTLAHCRIISGFYKR